MAKKKRLSELIQPYNVTPGGKMGPGAWMLSPDQRDRNSAHSLREMNKRKPRTTGPIYRA